MNSTKPVSRSFKNKNRKPQKQNRPKRQYPNYTYLLQALDDPSIRRVESFERRQIAQLGKATKTLFDTKSPNYIRFTYHTFDDKAATKPITITHTFKDLKTAQLWVMRRLESLYRLDQKRRMKSVRNAWRTLEYFNTRLDNLSKGLNQ